MRTAEWEWSLADGTRMQAYEWRPDGGERAVVGVVHGMGEHAGRYQELAERLTREGFLVLAFDQRGHGRTNGRRGDAPSYEALFEGIDRMLAMAMERYAALPRFLYGHSMGGNVTLNYLLRRKPELHGAVVSSPWLRLSHNPPPLKVILGRLLERIYPTFTDRRGLAVERLTSDPVVAERIIRDPLGHGHITSRFFFGTVRAGIWALSHADEIGLPVLLMHGDDDKVTSYEASRQFAERAGSLCTFKTWPGYQHELHNETGREQVFQTAIAWMEDRIRQDGNHGNGEEARS